MNNKQVTRYFFTLLVSSWLLPSAAVADSHRCDRRGFAHSGYAYAAGPYRSNPWQAQSGWGGRNWGRGNGNSFSGYNSGSPIGYGFQESASNLIRQGVQDGRLSPREQQELWGQARNIRWQEAQFERDGYLSAREREQLEDRREDFYRDLRHELNDGEFRRGW